jgi:chitodextrinase
MTDILDSDGIGLGDAEALTVTLDDAEAIGLSDGETLSVTIADTDGISLADGEALELTLGDSDAVWVQDSDVALVGDATEVRNHPHRSKLYLVAKEPRFIWKGVVQYTRGQFKEADGNLYTDMTIQYSSGANESGFDLANFLPDVTCWIGTDEELSDRGKCRVVSHDAPNSQLTVVADASCVWRAGDRITITDLHELWPRPQRITVTDDTATVYKDWSVADRVEQPVPIMGPPAVAGVGDTVVFDGSLSYLVGPNSLEYQSGSPEGELGWPDQGITSYSWWFEGGTPSTSSAKRATVTYAAAGQYVARLTVTGQNGESAIGFRNVFIVDDPITAFTVTRMEGSLQDHGWEAEVEVYDETFDPTVLPNHAQVVLYADEYFDGVAKTAHYGNNYRLGRGNVKLVGWAVDARVSHSSGGERRAHMTIQGLQSYLTTVANVPAYFTQADAAAPDFAYFDVNDAYYTDELSQTWYDVLTVRKFLYHLIRWHWTLFTFTDVHLPNDHNNILPGMSFPEGPLGKQLDEFCRRTQSRWAVDCGGSLVIFSWMNWLPVSGDGAIWRFQYPVILDITSADYETLDIEPRVSREVARVRVEGVIAFDTGAYQTSVDLAPGDSRGFRGETVLVANQILGTGGFEGSQGTELARMVYAEHSRKVESIRLKLCGNYSLFDIVPWTNKLSVTLDAGTFRGYSWTAKPFWVTGVTLSIEPGDIATTLECVPETWGLQNIDSYGEYHDVGEDLTDVPVGGNFSFHKLVGELAETDGLIPALMGDGTSHVSPEAGMAYVRLWGDDNQVVLAENRTLKPVVDRPCLVRQNERDTIGKPLYEVVAARRATDGDEELDRAYQEHNAVLVVGGTLAADGVSDFNLPYYGASTRKVVAISATVKTPPVGAGIAVSVLRNGGSIGGVGIADGSSSGYSAVTEDVTLNQGDVLSLLVTGVGSTTAGSDLTVEVVTREYGV